MRDAIGDADTVVNLIGKHYETKHLCFTRKEDGSINRVNSSFKNVRILRRLIRMFESCVGVFCQLPSEYQVVVFAPSFADSNHVAAQPIKQHHPAPGCLAGGAMPRVPRARVLTRARGRRTSSMCRIAVPASVHFIPHNPLKISLPPVFTIGHVVGPPFASHPFLNRLTWTWLACSRGPRRLRA